MTQKKKAAVAAKVVAKPVTAVKPPKKLIPRLAPKAELMPESSVSEVPPVASPVMVPAAVAATAVATAKARPPRKPSKEDETVARHQKVLAEALEMAQAIKYDQPKMMRPELTKEIAKEKKGAKPVKPKKPKLVRDSYAMPEVEYAQIAELKMRLLAQGTAVKKNELLRGGIAALAALTDAELKAVMAGVERIKTGRPAK